MPAVGMLTMAQVCPGENWQTMQALVCRLQVLNWAEVAFHAATCLGRYLHCQADTCNKASTPDMWINSTVPLVLEVQKAALAPYNGSASDTVHTFVQHW
jgi:hypothetical protein